jgi:aryl-alcohol dehydrogenase-like predicted oxidoreductase|eukprot:COSAG02_NODE_90_length_37755_cov_29.833364_14_plen_72_part_00
MGPLVAPPPPPAGGHQLSVILGTMTVGGQATQATAKQMLQAFAAALPAAGMLQVDTASSFVSPPNPEHGVA